MSESSGGQFEIDGNGRIPFEGELQTHFRSFKNAVSSNDRSSPELLADMTAAMTARETGGEQYSAGGKGFSNSKTPSVTQPQLELHLI